MMNVSSLNRLRKLKFPSRCKRFSSTTHNQFEEHIVDLSSHKIRYVKVGSGPKTILFFNGALGSFRYDFRMQLKLLDRDKFTLISWDMPGLGLSRPPNRRYHINFLEEDADFAFEFIKELNVEKCSLIGWCDGGISSLIFASKYPEHVENVVVTGVTPYFLEKEIPLLERMRDLRNWGELPRQAAIQLYGKELAQEIQNSYVDAIIEIYKKKNGDMCSSHLKNIKCPTLILHGDGDVLAEREHSSYLLENIKGAKLIRFQKGAHNIQIGHTEEFNKWVTKFILHPHEINEKLILV